MEANTATTVTDTTVTAPAKDSDVLRDLMSRRNKSPYDAVTFGDLIALQEDGETAPEREAAKAAATP